MVRFRAPQCPNTWWSVARVFGPLSSSRHTRTAPPSPPLMMIGVPLSNAGRHRAHLWRGRAVAEYPETAVPRMRWAPAAARPFSATWSRAAGPGRTAG